VTTRWTKLLLLAAVALYYTFVVFDNLTDFNSNYEFVRHVLLMDSTFPGNHGMWRAIQSPGLHLAFYWMIIGWEFASMVLMWWGVVNLFLALRQPASAFNLKKRVAIIALTVSLLMWLVAFLEVGGDWFLMWQSPTWNGQQEAFRMFAILGIVLLLLLQGDVEQQA
jgi:predicted small integral membrane protein